MSLSGGQQQELSQREEVQQRVHQDLRQGQQVGPRQLVRDGRKDGQTDRRPNGQTK